MVMFFAKGKEYNWQLVSQTNTIFFEKKFIMITKIKA